MEQIAHPAKSTYCLIRKATDLWEAEMFGRRFVGTYDEVMRWTNRELELLRRDARLRRGISQKEIDAWNRSQGV